MKKICTVLLVLALLLPAAAAGGEGNGRHLTLMIYLCGSDLESQYGLATQELQEIREACKGNRAVTVLVMAGGSRIWHGGQANREETVLCEIGARGMRIVEHLPAMNMGDAETLSALLRAGAERYPADQYALVFWDHGAGPMEGVCFDDANGMDSLSLRELASALEGSPFAKDLKLSWIGFDACLMATVETALFCEPYADYFIASQETEPGSGWNYGFLGEITGKEDALEICRMVIGFYPEGKDEHDMLTLSLVRLNRMKEVERSTEVFFDAINRKLTPETFSEFSNNRKNTKGFGRVSTNSDYDLADLYSLAENYEGVAPAEAEALENVLDQAVIETTGNQEHSRGLSVYCPYYNRDAFGKKWKDSFRGLGVLTDYSLYMNRYDELWSGKPMATWDRLTGYTSALSEQGTQTILLDLTDEQRAHYAGAVIHILEDNGTDYTYMDTYCMDDVRLRGNTLEVEYSFEALYAVDENGVLETEAIPFVRMEGYYMIHAFLQKESVFAEEKDPDRIGVYLICKRKAGTDELEICNVIPSAGSTDGFSFGRYEVGLDPDAWPVIRFLDAPMNVAKNEKGDLLPFEEWTENTTDGNSICLDGIDRDGNRIPVWVWSNRPEGAAGLHQETEADNTRPWTLKFCPRKASGRNLAAQYVVTDTQGNRWGSRLIPLDRPDVCGRAEISCEPAERDGLRFRPVEIRAIRSGSFRGVCLRMLVENRSDRGSYFVLLSPVLNGRVGGFNCLDESTRALKGGSGSASLAAGKRCVNPGETCYVEFYLDESLLPFADDPVVRSVTFIPCVLHPAEESGNSFRAEYVTFGTELDVSALDLPRRPGGTPLASGLSDDGNYCLEVTELRKTDDALLSGTLHLVNRDDEAHWIASARAAGDTLGVGMFSGGYVRDCMDMDFLYYFIPGGESYIGFRVVPDRDLCLRVFTGVSDENGNPIVTEERDVAAAESIGFCCEVYGADIYDRSRREYPIIELELSDPVVLDAPWRLRVK